MTLILITGLQLLAAGVWGIRLIVDPEPLSLPAGALLGSEVLLIASIAVSGVLLTGAVWAHRLLLGLHFFTLGVAAEVVEFTALSVTGVGITLVAIALAASPLLTVHLRRLPPAEPLPPASLALGIGLLLIPAVVALVGRPSLAGWAYALAGVLVGWAYARATRTGLWAARMLIPVLGVQAGTTSQFGIGIAASGILLGLIAWHPGAALATRQLLPPSVPPTFRRR